MHTALSAETTLESVASPERHFDARQITALIGRVRAEFMEMPGLQLTLAQATRLWSLDAATSEAVLGSLIGTGFVVKRGERYSRGPAT